MKIQCDNCAILHELDPPAWVVSSGRPFRFRCSSCGHSQSVMPDTLPDDTPPPPPPPPEPVTRSVRPADPPRTREQTPLPVGSGPRTETPGPGTDGAVFLKQNGQIYMVRDWDTLKRWITERRVDRHDLVSEGGVRWEPIGSRRDLAHLFGPTLAPAADDEEPMSEEVLKPAPVLPENEPVDLGGNMPFEMPFMGASTGAVLQGAWHDDDTEGIPTGLPALPRQLAPGQKPSLPPTPFTALDDPEDAFGENPTYALPPPTVDPAHDRARASVSVAAGGMTYVAPESDSAIPESTPARQPGLHDLPTKPPTQVPAALSSPPNQDLGWDDLIVGEDAAESPAPAEPASYARTPVRAPVVVPPPAIDISHPSLGVKPTHVPILPEEPEEQGNFLARDLGRMAFAALMFTMLLFVVYVATFAARNAPATALDRGGEPDAELGTVLPTDAPQPQVASEPEQPAPAPAPDVAPEPEPEPVPAPAAPAPAPAPPPVPVPAPAAPAPKPTPPPRPPAPKPAPSGSPSLGQLIDQGWSAVEGNPAKAAKLFGQALELSASHAEANYGYGYAQLQLGDKGAAQSHLCKALAGGTVDVKREVMGLLENNQLGCN